jgi:hypothetical protein
VAIVTLHFCFSVSSLFYFRELTNFYVLILYPVILVNLSVTTKNVLGELLQSFLYTTTPPANKDHLVSCLIFVYLLLLSLTWLLWIKFPVLLLWSLLAEIGRLLKQVAGSNVLLCQHRLSGLGSKADSWEQRGLTLYTLASRLQKQKARLYPYIVIFNFIGYFTLVLCDFPLPGAMWPSSCSDFSGSISLLCHLYFPATFSELKSRLFSSDLPPCYITPLWCLDPLKVKKHHLNLGVCIFVTSLHISPRVSHVGSPDKHNIKWHLVFGL